MREIKFRAWDRQKKEMRRVTLLDFNEWWVSCRPAGVKADPLEYGERNSFKNEETDRHILMLFIGLKDIWESDVMRSKDGLRKYIVTYSEKFGCWYLKGIGEAWQVDIPTWNDYEKIGDIYNNPELLEKR